MSKTPEEVVKAQAERLGGGWRMEQGVMPLVVLTTLEASALIQKLEERPLAYKYESTDGTTQIFSPDDITLIYASDGI